MRHVLWRRGGHADRQDLPERHRGRLQVRLRSHGRAAYRSAVGHGSAARRHARIRRRPAQRGRKARRNRSRGEGVVMSETETLTAARVPTVYFIDDSATMREVIKIAFRKENIHVVTCPDAATALAQFGETTPDAVITDVIMPDKDGYEVCQFIKQHELLGKTPVILMSGVVNRTVAEKAMQVKADELVRKPFQPQDLIARVKSLLNPGSASRGSLRDEEANASEAASRVLSG